MKKIVPILEMLPLIIILVITCMLSARGINCASGLGWKTCSFTEGILRISQFIFPFIIAALFLFIDGIIKLIRLLKRTK